MSAFEHLSTLAEGGPLSKSLPSALRIATEIEDDDFASWIRLELMGYFSDNPAMKKETIVPEYRSVPGQWSDDFGRVLVLDDPRLEFVNEIRLRHGVAELEGIATSTGMLAMRVTDLTELIRNNLNVNVTTFHLGPSSVSQVLTNIKMHLLDRLATQQDKISALAESHLVQEPEVLQLKPTFYGVSVDLKALWRRISSRKG